MPRRPILLLTLALFAGCTSPEPTATEPVTSASTSTTLPATTTTTAIATTSTTTPGPPVAWLTTSGVPVAVTGVEGDMIEVLTPCGYAALVDEGTPIYEVEVVIDPGHGGPIDTGAVASTGLQEKRVNLEVGLAVHSELEERGIASMLTRNADYPVPIRTRTGYADLVGARALVSIHHNAPAAPASEIPGIEIFVQQGSSESQRLGGLLYDATMAALGAFDVDWDRAPDAGVMTVLNSDGRDAYGMVRRPKAASALVELGYIANRAEAELYATDEYAPAAAEAIADAIEEFLRTDNSGAPLVEGRNFDPQSGVGQDQCIEPELGATVEG
ncbi:MAG TPA: N-acetylmuramoyl-L-alanine amidase [Acidimicrobiia bacterium]|nr:N-acetylmuramoyl-L-alanine amidase [Acidimicrobiia bacterium]